MSKRVFSQTTKAPVAKRQKSDFINLLHVDVSQIYVHPPTKVNKGFRSNITYGNADADGPHFKPQWGKQFCPFAFSNSDGEGGEGKDWRVAIGLRNVTRNTETGEWFVKQKDGTLHNLTGYDLRVYQKWWEINCHIEAQCLKYRAKDMYNHIIRPSKGFRKGDSPLEEQLIRTKLFQEKEDESTGEKKVLATFVGPDNEPLTFEEALAISQGSYCVYSCCVPSVFYSSGDTGISVSISVNTCHIINAGTAPGPTRQAAELKEGLYFGDDDPNKYAVPPKPKQVAGTEKPTQEEFLSNTTQEFMQNEVASA